jgi:hypothetical protein
MKKSELLTVVESGVMVCVGTFVSARLETISVRDKTSGSRRAAYVEKQIIMTDNEPVVVSRWLKDEEKPDEWKNGFKRGQKVVVKVRPDGNNGIPVIAGTLEELV